MIGFQANWNVLKNLAAECELIAKRVLAARQKGRQPRRSYVVGLLCSSIVTVT
jgi:hypothetical protein